MKTTRWDPQLAGAPGAGLNANVSMQTHAPTLHLRLPLDLPFELRMALLGFLLPATPFLSREDEPVRRFPVAGAIRDLRAVSETCTELNELVGQLRRRPEHAAAFELACRDEYEFKQRKDASARQTCIRRYNIDPVFSTAPPGLLRLQLVQAAQLQGICKELRDYGDQIRELRLYINVNFEAPPTELRTALGACVALRKLELATNSVLPAWLTDAISALPALQTLTVEAKALAKEFMPRLAQGVLAPRLRSLNLAVRDLVPTDLLVLAAAARDLPALHFLAISRAAMELDHCRALAEALPGFPQLQGLTLGRHHGRVSSEGMGILVKALVEQGKLRRLGMYNLDDVQETTTLLQALKDYGRLQEFAFGGRLLQGAMLQPWDLLAGASTLQSLVIDGCALDEPQLKALAQALEGSSVRELHIGAETFTNHSAQALVTAIRNSGSLRGLTLENCKITVRQARALGKAIARSKLLVLRVLYEQDAEDAAEAQSTLIDQAKKSTTLLQFGTGKVSKGSHLMHETLRLNRLR